MFYTRNSFLEKINESVGIVIDFLFPPYESSNTSLVLLIIILIVYQGVWFKWGDRIVIIIVIFSFVVIFFNILRKKTKWFDLKSKFKWVK